MIEDQLERIMNSSVSEVEELSNLKKSMCENDFYLMLQQELSKFILNPKVVSMLIDTSNNSYELNRLFQMKGSAWYSNTILSFCNLFREAMQSNRRPVIDMVESEYPSVHQSLENYHDSYFLQHQKISENPRHVVRAYFRMMGDTIESAHFPLIHFIYKITALTPSSPLYGRPLNVSNGKAVSELLENGNFHVPLKEFLLGISLNQWRNISSHSSYKYENNTKSIICSYGNDEERILVLDELEGMMVNLDILQAMLKTCVEFPILEFMQELNLLASLKITEESIFSQLGTSLPIHGYKFKGVQKDQKDWVIQVGDAMNRDPELFVKDSKVFLHTILMLRHNGINAKIEFFDASGKSVKQLFLQIEDNN